MATKETTTPLKDVAHAQTWELNNVQALLAAMDLLLEEMDDNEIRWKVIRLNHMATKTVDSIVDAFQPYI